jgi:hypothetical protein
MATSFNANLIPEQSTDAAFRAWATWVAGVFALASTWTNTADTGQINLTTVTRPTVANTSQGYKIYSMNDTLQATKPVFVKIEFGSGSNAAYPALWLTIGTGSDGAGNLTGVLFPRTQIACVASSTTGSAAYGSANTNRVAMGFFAGVTNCALAFSIERTKGANGDDDGTGLLASYSYSTSTHRTQYIPFTGTIPVAETCYQALTSTNNPSALDNNVGIGLVSHFYGTAKQPGINNVVVNSNDFADYATFSMTLYGGSKTFQHLGPNFTTVNSRTATRLCMIYQ